MGVVENQIHHKGRWQSEGPLRSKALFGRRPERLLKMAERTVGTAPKIELLSGQKIPLLGLGTLRSGKDVVHSAVKDAVKQGYRLLDCAEVYGNEEEVGLALAELLAQDVVKREELFVISKVFNNHHQIQGEGKNRVREACEASVKALGVGAIDLYLMHWPFAFLEEQLPKDGLRLPDGRPRPEITISIEYLQTWKEMEKLVEDGLVKAIGVSNFTQQQIEELMQASNIIPAVNQVEFHPYLFQQDLMQFCASHAIKLMAYSPLGAGNVAGGQSLLEHTAVTALAKKYGRSAGQVLIRWNVQLGNICIPKSTTSSRIAENLDAFSWQLTPEDMKLLSDLNMDHRFTRGFVEGQWFDDGEINGVERSCL